MLLAIWAYFKTVQIIAQTVRIMALSVRFVPLSVQFVPISVWFVPLSVQYAVTCTVIMAEFLSYNVKMTRCSRDPGKNVCLHAIQ